MRWPDELIGRNSVTAWTSDKTTAWNGVKVALLGDRLRGRQPRGGDCIYFPPVAGDTAPPRRAAGLLDLRAGLQVERDRTRPQGTPCTRSSSPAAPVSS